SQLSERTGALKERRDEIPISFGEDAAARDAVQATEVALQDAVAARKRGDYDAATQAVNRAAALDSLGAEAAREGRAVAHLRVVYLPGLALFTLVLAVAIFAAGRRGVAAAWAERAQITISLSERRLKEIRERLGALRERQAPLLEGPSLHDRL